MINPFSKRPSIDDFFPCCTSFIPRTMSSSDVEMPSPSNSDSEPGTSGQVCVARRCCGLQTGGPERASFKDKQYVWKAHKDNRRAFIKPSVIWQLGDEYEKVGSGDRRKYWRCGLCNEGIIEASECLKNWWDCGLIQQLEEEEAI
jgi:hypothetical protein